MKQFSCGDVVPGCQRTFRASDEQTILTLVHGHAIDDHGLASVPAGPGRAGPRRHPRGLTAAPTRHPGSELRLAGTATVAPGREGRGHWKLKAVRVMPTLLR